MIQPSLLMIRPSFYVLGIFAFWALLTDSFFLQVIVLGGTALTAIIFALLDYLHWEDQKRYKHTFTTRSGKKLW